MKNSSSLNSLTTLEALSRNLFQHKRSPGLIKLISLPDSFNHIKLSLLSKEIAFCLSSPFSSRLSLPRYRIAYNSLSTTNWDNLAVIELKRVESLLDIVAVSFDPSSLYSRSLNLSDSKLQSLFFDLLLRELEHLTTLH